VIPLLLALVLAAPASKSPAKPQKVPPKAAQADAGVSLLPPAGSTLEQAGEVKEIELDERRTKAVYRVRTATSLQAVIELPEPIEAASCGDCATADKPDAPTLFTWQYDKGGVHLAIAPRVYPGLQPDGSTLPASDIVTSVTVRMQSLTLTLQVELTEDRKLADLRVRFVLPNRSTESKFVTDAIAKAKGEMEAAFASRVEQAAADQLLRSFLEPHECRSNTARAREADMVLELKELCRFGRRIYVRFVLENRGRSLFIVNEVTTGIGDGKAFTSVESRSLLSIPEVAFQQLTEGIVSFDVDDPTAHSFELRLNEKGGRTRAVTLQDFSF
jgi:hypothetical protein